MMRPNHLLVAAVLLGLGACSALQPAEPLERDATYRLDRGLLALEGGKYREAFDDLAWVEAHCAGHVRGGEALVALAALELDPRNRGNRASLGTDLLGRVLRQPASPDWVRPLVETAYLMALSLGAPPAPDLMGAEAPLGDTLTEPTDTAAEPRADTTAAVLDDVAADRVPAPELLDPADTPAHGCGARIAAEAWASPRLPQLPGPALASLLAEAETSRSAAAARADSVGRELSSVAQRLAETEAELERIRKTLQP